MIGIFDSGLGGLTVVREIWRAAPEASILYLGDLARLPYGTKSQETICKYAEEDVRFLLQEGAEKIVIACNTVSSLAYDYLVSKFKNIEIFEVVIPAARQAAAISKNGRIGVIGTRATINSQIYEKRILELRSDAQVFSQAAPLLVSLIEEGWTKRSEIKTILRTYLQPLRNAHVDTLILACTHFPLIKDLIQARIGKHVQIINSAETVVKNMNQSGRWPIVNSQWSKNASHFFVTDLTSHWQTLAEKWLGRQIKLEVVSLQIQHFSAGYYIQQKDV